ncbi:MAG: nicotinamide mononucleotide transporter [Ruminococcaceae bacterium]|nr:nicotinamide mononucleotide transporter [Oscillospiraceae bacterium]
MKRLLNYFTKWELILWSSSVLFITVFFMMFDRSSYFNLITSLLGASALIFCAKGHPLGQLMIFIFGILYGIISYSFDYYGEMMTYMGMSCPMALIALISWLRHPYKGNKSEVEVNRLKGSDYLIGILLSLLVTAVFYFILKYFDTANLIPSTVSVTTTFFAVYLTAKRSPFYALAYAANDIVLIILWVLATFNDISYISVVVCFTVFLVNDIYGFINWEKMQKKQRETIDY